MDFNLNRMILACQTLSSRSNEEYRRRHHYDDAIIGITLGVPRWDIIQLAILNRNIYSPVLSLLSRSFDDVDAYRKSKSIYVSGYDVYKPVETLGEANFPATFYLIFSMQGFERPTPIQAQVWPIALSGRDVIGIAVTGSGKTLAFALPAIAQVIHQRQYTEGNDPLALVLAPTRELASQVHRVVSQFSWFTNVRSMCLYGGININVQTAARHAGVDIIVATPGRLMDVVSRGYFSLHFCSYVVIDEADLMLALGFLPQIKRILDQIRGDRQLLMFSATWSDHANEVASEILNNPIQVVVGSVNKNILQLVIVCQEEEKLGKLFHLLKEISHEKNKRTILFMSSKKKVNALSKTLQSAGFSVGALNGGMRQSKRENVLKAFSCGKITTLVTTDVASRGLDINGIRYVIIYDFPRETMVYIHRIGRTARGEKHGTAFTLFTERDRKCVDALVEILRSANQRVPFDLLELKNSAPSKKRKWSAEMEMEMGIS